MMQRNRMGFHRTALCRKTQLNHCDTQGLKWTFVYFANYNRIFGDHSFNAVPL